MNIVIPMAGAGSRFAKVGYTFPKPLISVHGDPMISVVVKNLNLNDRTHFFWMSPLQFDLALELFPEIINGNHSCGFGRTYNHIRKKLPKGQKVERFHSYSSWLEFYSGE